MSDLMKIQIVTNERVGQFPGNWFLRISDSVIARYMSAKRIVLQKYISLLLQSNTPVTHILV
jgi:hypothetical protein